MAFATAAEILAVIKNYRPDFVEADIDAGIHDLATADVNSHLQEAAVDITIAPTDINSYLKFAEICFYMERASQLRQVETVYGDLEAESIGKRSKRYVSGQPLLMVKSGSVLQYLRLLPHETWFLAAKRFVHIYSIGSFFKATGHFDAYGRIMTDESERGYNWNDWNSFVDTKDWS